MKEDWLDHDRLAGRVGEGQNLDLVRGGMEGRGGEGRGRQRGREGERGRERGREG